MFNEIELNELNESKINNYFYLDNENKIQIESNLSPHIYLDLLLSFKNSKNVINKILLNLKINNKFSFYIPELLSINNNEIKEFLLEISNNLKYNLILYWISNNLDFNSKLESSLINDIKINRINFDIKSNEDRKNLLIQTMKKNEKIEYYYDNIYFYSELNNICSKLNEISMNEREKFFQNQIKNLNNYIQNLNNKNEYFKGIILPFDNNNENENEEENYIIVNIVNEFSSKLLTKTRVPIKLTVELVKQKEIKDWKKKIEKIKIEKKNNNIIIKYFNNFIKNKKNNNEKKINEYSSVEDFFKHLEMKEKLKKINEIKNNINLCNKNPSEEQKIKNNLPNKNVLNSTLINLYQKEDTLCDLEKLPKNLNPFGKIFFDVILQEIKPFSKFKYFLSYNVKQFIYKFNDDLRQEFLIMQMIKLFKEIFSIENLPLNLTTYNIIITSNKSGIIEYIPNTISIHSLLKFLNKNKISLANFFTLFFNKNLLEAQKNFAESLAAYSLVCFILNIKDRHNENILLDYNGKIIHIDFGFALGISPGNLNFENAPFKITEDYINILGGIDSEIFVYFKSLFMKGLIAVKKYYKYFENILRLMFHGLFRNINCFEGKEIDEIVENMKKKFFLNLNEKDYNKIVDDIINESINNWRTGYYDYYQKLTNDIEY